MCDVHLMSLNVFFYSNGQTKTWKLRLSNFLEILQILFCACFLGKYLKTTFALLPNRNFTPSTQNFCKGLLFNYSMGCLSDMQPMSIILKWPSFNLVIQYKQLLDIIHKYKNAQVHPAMLENSRNFFYTLALLKWHSFISKF